MLNSIPAFALSTALLASAASAQNDLCEDAIPIDTSLGIQLFSGSTVGATQDPVGQCGLSNIGPGVWYSIEGPGRELTATTCSPGTTYDTQLSVYRGSCGALTCVVANDDDFSCPTSIFNSTVTWPAVAGETYFLLVHGFGAATTGDFDLFVSPGALLPPANDECSAAEPLALGIPVTGNTARATPDFAPICDTTNTARGVWYSVTGTGAVLTASTCLPASNYDTKLSVFTGSCGSLVCVGGNDDDFGCGLNFRRSRVDWPSVPGETYLVLVHGAGTGSGSYELVVDGVTPPPNDDPCSALPLALGGFQTFDIANATAQPGEVSPGPGSGPFSCEAQDGWCAADTQVQNSVWYSFVAPHWGTASIAAGPGDTQLAVYAAGDCADYTTFVELAANDGDGSVPSARIDALGGLTPGATYLVQVDGFNGAALQGDVFLSTPDSDGDGVLDSVDTTLYSDLAPTVIVDGCDSDAPNHLFSGGSTISDLISDLAGAASSHGEFVSSAAALLGQLRKAGHLTGAQLGAIQACVAKSNLP